MNRPPKHPVAQETASPVMSDTNDEASPASAPGPGRIRRNQACNSCRDAKVRCNPSAQPGCPCQRCAKLELPCVVDRTHKRVSRKSKIDELAREIQTIKRSVGSVPAAPPGPLWIPATSPGGGNGPASGYVAPSAPSPGLPTPATNPTLAAEPSLPRALNSHFFSGEDIDYYFDKFFAHFHPYLPIVRHRDPNRCYEAGPTLFWTILLVACRRYARAAQAQSFLTAAVRRELSAVVTSPPLTLHAINAIILVCAWVLPDTRFVNDATSLFAAAAVNSALPLGIHTGKGANPEFGFGIFNNNFSDEEAAYTWAGCNIVSQRVSQYLGLPPLSGLFNSTVQNVIDGKTPFSVPSSFRVLLECQKFANRVSKIMGACLDESRGVSSYMVRQLEDEFDSIRVLICSERADDMDRFNALAVQLEIQTYYMLPLPGYEPEGLKRNILRACATARAVVREALALDERHAFLQHAPHFYFRTLMSATCIVTTVLASSYADVASAAALKQSVADALDAVRRFVVQDGDLAARLASLFDSFHSLAQGQSRGARSRGEPVSTFTHRLGASITFACIRHWKDELASARSKSQPPKLSTQPPPPPADAGDALVATAVPGVGAGAEAASGIDMLSSVDWSFMDDFDWGLDPSLLTPGT